MSYRVKLLLILQILQTAYAAHDFVITFLSCKSLIEPNVTIVCSHESNLMSLKLEAKHPVSNIMVIIANCGKVLWNNFLLQVHFSYSRKSENGFVPMFKAPQFDWCALMADNSKVNPALKLILMNLKKSFVQFLHKCPYIGVYSAENAVVSRQYLMFHPSGLFQLHATVFIDAKKVLLFRLEYTMDWF